jgi:hypothetical protein
MTVWPQARLRVIAFHLGVQPNGEEITMSAFERLPAIVDGKSLDPRPRNDREGGAGPASRERSAQ